MAFESYMEQGARGRNAQRGGRREAAPINNRLPVCLSPNRFGVERGNILGAKRQKFGAVGAFLENFFHFSENLFLMDEIKCKQEGLGKVFVFFSEN